MLTDSHARHGHPTTRHMPFWRRWVDRIRKRRAYVATLRRLRGMTQAELDELGISRSMISRVAWESAYGHRK